tara:strand:- start:206 stop:475 length:270 start_codon:yes stop_codon:yes gene_type:complete
MEDIGLRGITLDDWWQDQLNKEMERHYPETIGQGRLVESYKIDGWNDGTSTLYGVYEFGGAFYVQCIFADYAEPKHRIVNPVFEHVGWK